MACSRGCCKSFAEHVRGVAFSANATPNRRPEAARLDATEKQWAADGDAYKRIRRQGLQPKDVDGCAELEKRADHVAELQAGRPLNKQQVKSWTTATGAVADAG